MLRSWPARETAVAVRTEAAVAAIEVMLFGAPRIRIGGEVFCGRADQLERLLVYLALHRGDAVSCDQLIASMWENDGTLPKDPAGALNNLLFKARQLLGQEVLVRDGQRVRVVLPAGSTIDTEFVLERTEALREGLEAGDWAQAKDAARAALDRMTGQLANGQEARWLEEQRRHFEDVRDEALACVARAGVELGQLDEGRDAARKLFARDKLSVSACRLLVQIELASGHTGAGIAAYDELMKERRAASIPSTLETQALLQLVADGGEVAGQPNAGLPHAGPAAKQAADPLSPRRSDDSHGSVWRRIARSPRVIGPVLGLVSGLVLLLAPGMSEAQVVVNRCLAAFAAGDPVELRRVLAPNVVLEETPKGKRIEHRGASAVIRRMMELNSYFDDIEYRILDPVEKDGIIRYDIEWSGKQVKPFPDGSTLADATGDVHDLQDGITTRVEDGLITKIVYRRYGDKTVDGSG